MSLRTLKLLGLGLVCALTPVLSGTASAQDMADDAEIVVTGQKPVSPEQARHYVRQIATSVEDQLARFRDPICPTVIGLPDTYGDVVVRRIRRVAQRAGAPIAPEKCPANVLIIVAADADQLVRDLRRSLPRLFNGLSTIELRRVMRDGPVHVWNASEVRNEANGRAGTASTTQTNKATPSLTVQSASIINLPTEQVIVQSVIVLDSKAMLGKTLMQISDYVTMRTLAGARPPAGDDGAPDSILSLFDPGATPPPSFTFVDATYLEALYHTRANQRALKQMNDISQRLAGQEGHSGKN